MKVSFKMKKRLCISLSFIAIVGLSWYILTLTVYNYADCLYNKLCHKDKATIREVNQPMKWCRQRVVPIQESNWGNLRTLDSDEFCIQYRVLGLHGWPIDVIFDKGSNVVCVIPSYE